LIDAYVLPIMTYALEAVSLSHGLSVGITCFGEFLICINGNLLKQYNIIVAVWIPLGFVTFAGYASCIKCQFVRM